MVGFSSWSFMGAVSCGSSKQVAESGLRFFKLCGIHLTDDVENDAFLDIEEALRTDVAVLRESATLEIALSERDGETVRAHLAGDLAKNEIVTGEINDNERRATLAGLQVGLREGQHHDIAPATGLPMRRPPLECPNREPGRFRWPAGR